MTIKEYLAILSLLAITFNIYWSLYIAYPVVIDTSIKKGKSWLYLPLKWKGMYKRTVTWATPIFNLCISILVAVTLWFYLLDISPIYFGLATVVLALANWSLASFSRKRRFIQQEDSFFYIRSQINGNMHTQGKSLSESEINSLAAFQHQNILREADKSGKLGEIIVKQSQMAKNHDSQKKVKSIS